MGLKWLELESTVPNVPRGDSDGFRPAPPQNGNIGKISKREMSLPQIARKWKEEQWTSMLENKITLSSMYSRYIIFASEYQSEFSSDKMVNIETLRKGAVSRKLTLMLLHIVKKFSLQGLSIEIKFIKGTVIKLHLKFPEFTTHLPLKEQATSQV